MKYYSILTLLLIIGYGCSMEPQVTVDNVEVKIPINEENCVEMAYAVQLCIIEYPEAMKDAQASTTGSGTVCQ